MKLALPAMALLAALMLAVPTGAQSSQNTGDLFLRADGSLGPAPSPPGQACLALSPTSSSTAAATFEGTFTNQTFFVDNQTVAVSFALGQGGTAGSGFTLAGTLRIGNLTESQNAKQYSPGASIDSPTQLIFSVPSGSTAGIVHLEVTLSKAGTGPLAVGQNVAITCNDPDTRIHGFPYRTTTTNSTMPPTEEPASGGGSLSIPSILGIAVMAGLTTLIAGALVLSGRSISQRRIHFLLGATAGLLLAIAMLDLVPEALEVTEAAPITIVIALLVLFLIRHFAGEHGHDHTGGHGAGHEDPGHEHTHEHAATHVAGLAFIAFFALGFHRFVDGLVLPAAFEAGSGVGFAAAGAVLIHQFPDGVAAASLFLAAGWARRKVLGGVAVMAVLTPIGALVGLLLLGQEILVGHLIALAAATFIFISLAELLPELRAKEQRAPVGIGFLVGYAVAFLIVIVPALVGVKV